MIVAGSMIGSGIFIVSADIARQVGSPGWLLVVWIITGLLTIVGALVLRRACGDDAEGGRACTSISKKPTRRFGDFFTAGRIFSLSARRRSRRSRLRSADSPAFSFPAISESNYLIEPIRIGSSSYAFSLSTAQLVGIVMIALLTWMNTRGLKLGKLVQNVFTFAKTGSLIALDRARNHRRACFVP